MKKKITYAIMIVLCACALTLNIYFSVLEGVSIAYILKNMNSPDMINALTTSYYAAVKALILFIISSLCILAVTIFFIRALVFECLPALREKIVEKLREKIEVKNQQKLIKAEQDKAKRIKRLEKELDELKKDK